MYTDNGLTVNVAKGVKIMQLRVFAELAIEGVVTEVIISKDPLDEPSRFSWRVFCLGTEAAITRYPMEA